MADNNPVAEVVNNAISEIEGESANPKKISLEALTLLLLAERLKKLEENSKTELEELRARQKKVAFLHKLMKAINTATAKEGTFDCTNLDELREMMAKAKEMDADIDIEKTVYNNEERERLIENIKMSIEDMNVQNELQLQTVTRVNNERYESYQLARSILKPLHDAKLTTGRNIRL